MVGRISPQKAPDVFVKMAKLVKDEIPNAHFVIVGSGNQEAEIRKYAEENKFADSLHITGWVDDPMSYVELFDVACLLSRWEGFGLALPEYMMAGKPIVASRVDAIPNIIRNGENGLLVEVDDATGASEAVLQIYRDRSLKDKLVSKGVEDVHNRFDAQRVSEEHGILFENMWKVYEENGRCEAAEVAALCLANLYNSGGHRKITPDEYETIKKYLQKFPESIRRYQSQSAHQKQPQSLQKYSSKISNNLSLNSVHQYTHQPIIQPLITPTLRSASGQGGSPGSRTLRRSSTTR